MEYISKEDAIDCVLSQYCASSDETEEALGNAIEEIKKRPAADVVERKCDEEFEWCTDCKEYDHDRHCCPRFSRVINTTLQDIRVEVVEDIIELINNAAVVSPSKDYRDGFNAFKEVLVEVIKERYPDDN